MTTFYQILLSTLSMLTGVFPGNAEQIEPRFHCHFPLLAEGCST